MKLMTMTPIRSILHRIFLDKNGSSHFLKVALLSVFVLMAGCASKTEKSMSHSDDTPALPSKQTSVSATSSIEPKKETVEKAVQTPEKAGDTHVEKVVEKPAPEQAKKTQPEKKVKPQAKPAVKKKAQTSQPIIKKKPIKAEKPKAPTKPAKASAKKIETPKPAVQVKQKEPTKQDLENELKKELEPTTTEEMPAASEEKAPLETEISDVAAPALNSLDELPLSFGGTWTLDRAIDQIYRKECFLSYKTLKMDDGQGKTPANLIINKNSIILKTKSNIDTTYPDSGLRIDDNLQVPVEKLFNESAIIYKESYTMLVGQMTQGEQATFDLGFWPTWPVTQTYPVSFELAGFPEAYRALEACSMLEQQLK